MKVVTILDESTFASWDCTSRKVSIIVDNILYIQYTICFILKRKRNTLGNCIHHPFFRFSIRGGYTHLLTTRKSHFKHFSFFPTHVQIRKPLQDFTSLLQVREYWKVRQLFMNWSWCLWNSMWLSEFRNWDLVATLFERNKILQIANLDFQF